MIQTPGTSSQYQASILAALQTTGITNTSPGAKARAFCDATGDQVSPPFRNQNISRARQTEAHSRGRMRLPCYLALCQEDRFEWVHPDGKSLKSLLGG
jgi:hypothetical protein